MPLSFDSLVLAPCVAAFGEAAQGYPVPTYTPQAGAPPFALDGVFDAGFQEADLLSGPAIAAAQPNFGCRLADVPTGVALQQGDTIAIRGADYAVREVRPDSHGHVRLLLNLAS